MIQIIEATNAKTEKNLDGDKSVSMSQGEGLNAHTVQNMCSLGFEFAPADGEKLVIAPINGSDSYMVSIAGVNENITPVCLKGERRIYSVSADGQTIKAFAKFKNTGVLELNGNDNFAVLYTELKTAFDQLKTDQNAILNLLKTWAVALTDGGTALQTAALLLAPSTADMSLSKSVNVLLKSNEV